MDINNIFHSKTRRELWRLYFTNPEGEYYLRELERLLKIPVSMLRQELIHLEEQGLFVSQKKGNLLYFSLNKKFPLYEEFKSIVFKTIGVKGALEKMLQKIKAINLAFLYGSFAKDEAQAKSDIDLFLVGHDDDDELVGEITKLEKFLKREINYSLYSPVEFKKERKKQGGFVNLLLKDKILILKGSLNVTKSYPAASGRKKNKKV